MFTDEPIDLAEIFTDEVITEMTTPFFGEIWPRLKEGQEEGELIRFLKVWGTDPDSTDPEKDPLPEFTFSMSDSVLDAGGSYSNLTHKENYSAKIHLTKDVAYRMSVVADPPLPAGAAVEVRIGGSKLDSHIFDASSTEPWRIVLTSNSAESPTPWLLGFTLISPKVYVPRETKITVRLVPSY
jgi:hypothetical protein